MLYLLARLLALPELRDHGLHSPLLFPFGRRAELEMGRLDLVAVGVHALPRIEYFGLAVELEMQPFLDELPDLNRKILFIQLSAFRGRCYEILLQASNDAPQFVEFSLQLEELLLRDVLLRPGDSKQDKEEGLLGIRLVEPFKPLFDDGEVVRHDRRPDELKARLFDLLREGELFRLGEVLEQGVDIFFEKDFSLLLQS